MMDETEERGRRLRPLAALDNVRQSYRMLRESFDAEVCADLLEWLQASQEEVRALMALTDRRCLH